MTTAQEEKEEEIFLTTKIIVLKKVGFKFMLKKT